MNPTLFYIKTLVLILRLSWGFNVDTNYPTYFQGDANSMFGYTVALHHTNKEPIALVGAPKSNSPTVSAKNPGSIFKCSVKGAGCQHLTLENRGNPDDKPTYKELKDDMGLGMSIDIQSEDPGRVAVCAPNWRNMQSDYFVNGMCYILNKNLDANSCQKVVPLADKNNQIRIPLAFYYGYGQAGFSVHFNKYGDELNLGAPGFHNWIGSVINYNTKTSPLSKPVIPDVPKELIGKSDLYLGYSLSSGKFFGGQQVWYAAGAPRDGNLRGRIYIFGISRVSDKTTRTIVNVTVFQEGQQFGEYFGASLLSIDVNGDDISDLIVGAPLHALAKGVDNGRIYEYIGSSSGMQLKSKCSGSSKLRARFGTALADLGDINKDGYNDLAVGAPYEEDVGAIYIYHGSSSGISCNYVQRISALQFPKMKGGGFGISISRALDIDSNNYPDLLIGSYGANSAVLLRSKPVAKFTLSLKSDIPNILSGSLNCQGNIGSDPCLMLTYCLGYTGRHVRPQLDVKVSVSIDKELQIANLQPRAAFGLTALGKPKFEENSTIGLNADVNNCKKIGTHIWKTKHTFADPINFRLSYELPEPSSGGFCNNCPSVDPRSPTFINLQVPFVFNCGTDNVCEADLILSARNYGREDNTKPMVIGIDRIINLEIQVINVGERAYGSLVEVRFPKFLAIINQGNCEKIKSSLLATHLLKCSIGNPLIQGERAVIDLKLDASKVSEKDQIVTIDMVATTLSKELRAFDNQKQMALVFVSQHKLRISGVSLPPLVAFDSDNENFIEFHHRYTVYSSNTPVPKASVHIFIPGFVFNLGDIVNITNILVSGSATCTSSRSEIEEFPAALTMGDDLESPSRSDQPNNQRDHFNLDCLSTSCQTIDCVAGPLNNDNNAVISIKGTVNWMLAKKLANTDNLETISLVSKGEAFLLRNDVIDQMVGDNSLVNTRMVKLGFEQEEIPTWVIVVAIVSGIGLLALLTGLLVWMGFFRRQKIEDMEELKKEGILLDQSTQNSD